MDVIVNADDLGISEVVNEATFALIGQGLVTSSTLLANGPNIQEACNRISDFPNCSFGAHLNVTEFKPLSGSGKLEPLLDDDGFFDPGRIRQSTINSDLAEGILEEFSAQIEKLSDSGVQISHLDSHHYVLSIAKMLPILKRVQKRFQIRKVRISRNIYAEGLISKSGLTHHALGVDSQHGDRDISKILRLKKSVYNLVLRRYYRTKTCDGFSGFRLFYEYAKSRSMKQRTFEVNVHPANPYYDSEEAEILQQPWSQDLNFQVRLISYDEL